MFGRVIQVNYFCQKVVMGLTETLLMRTRKTCLSTHSSWRNTPKHLLKNHNIDVLIGVANESTTNDANYLRLKFTDPELGTPITGTIIETSSTGTNNNKSESSLNSFSVVHHTRLKTSITASSISGLMLHLNSQKSIAMHSSHRVPLVTV
jgi:uncharacterized protein (DUF736 family)